MAGRRVGCCDKAGRHQLWVEYIYYWFLGDGIGIVNCGIASTTMLTHWMVLWTPTLTLCGIAFIGNMVLRGVVRQYWQMAVHGIVCLGNGAKLGVPSGGGRGTLVLK